MKCITVSASVFVIFATCGCGGSRNSTDDTITIVGRQNSSGTYAYFQERVLGKNRDYTNNTIDQSGSKDVVELVGKTPGAIGYSGMGYATHEVKMLYVSEKKIDEPVAPTVENAMADKYPLARPLYMYVLGKPEGAVKHYIEWIMSKAGQDIIVETGYVPLENVSESSSDPPPPEDVAINIAGSDTMVNVAGRWAEVYNGKYSNVSPQVTGGGSGTGIAGLINGQIDIANASRPMKPSEREDAAANAGGKEIIEYIVGRDALAVYVHKDNPLESISIEELAEIYGDGGSITGWSQLKGWPK